MEDTEAVDPSGARQMLDYSETRLRLAMKATGLGWWDFRQGEEIVGSNDEVARLLGYRPEEFAETRSAFVARLHPDDREWVRQCFRDYLDGRRDEYAIEFRMRTRDGQYRWFRSVGQIVERDAEGRASRVVGTYLDIDELRSNAKPRGHSIASSPHSLAIDMLCHEKGDQVLTLRQREILQLIAEGFSSRDIAGRLKISIKTVETHRAELMRRLAIYDVAGLTRFAIRTGLVSADLA